MRVSRSWRFRMIACAFCGSRHNSGSSARAFSSASSLSALFQSKMPPQQPDRLLHFFDNIRDFGTHHHEY